MNLVKVPSKIESPDIVPAFVWFLNLKSLGRFLTFIAHFAIISKDIF